MKRILQMFVLVALAFYNAIQTVTGGATLKRLVPTGVITQGILGGFSGKVGPVVGAKWKDIDYMRGYKVPANPNTTAQQAVRAKFAAMVVYGRTLLPSILNPFWDPFYSNMSGFNAWISQNYDTMSVANELTQNSIFAKGTLEKTSGITPSINGGTGECIIAWETTATGNGEDTDLAVVLAFDLTTGVLYSTIGDVARSVGTDTLTLPDGLADGDVLCSVFFYRGTGSAMIVSDSESGFAAEV